MTQSFLFPFIRFRSGAVRVREFFKCRDPFPPPPQEGDLFSSSNHLLHTRFALTIRSPVRFPSSPRSFLPSFLAPHHHGFPFVSPLGICPLPGFPFSSSPDRSHGTITAMSKNPSYFWTDFSQFSPLGRFRVFVFAVIGFFSFLPCKPYSLSTNLWRPFSAGILDATFRQPSCTSVIAL